MELLHSRDLANRAVIWAKDDSVKQMHTALDLDKA
jgi:hypothetical protein